MHPFHNRPNPSDAYVLRTGDFEAAPQPRPVFYRQEAVGPHHGPYGHDMMSAPPPPNSLAPVAMGYPGYPHRQHPTDGGVSNTQSVQVSTHRPTWRTGAMILLAGVFVGGTFGVGVQARRNAMEAQLDAQAQAVAAAQPMQAPQQPVTATAPGPTPIRQTPAQPPPQAYAQAPASMGLPPGAIVIPPQPGVTVVTQPPAASVARPAAAPAPAPKRNVVAWHPAPAVHPHHSAGFVAAKVQPPPKADKPEKAEAPAKSGKSTTEAEKILKDAIGETTNTL